MGTGDLLDQVDLTHRVVAPEAGDPNPHPVFADVIHLVPQRDQEVGDLGLCEGNAQEVGHPRRPQVDKEGLVWAGVHVEGLVVQRPARRRQDDLGRPENGRLPFIRIDPSLEPVARVGRHPQSPARGPDLLGLEKGAFQKHVHRVVGDLRVPTAHDPTDAHRPLGVTDHEHVFGDRTFFTVQRP